MCLHSGVRFSRVCVRGCAGVQTPRATTHEPDVGECTFQIARSSRRSSQVESIQSLMAQWRLSGEGRRDTNFLRKLNLFFGIFGPPSRPVELASGLGCRDHP